MTFQIIRRGVSTACMIFARMEKSKYYPRLITIAHFLRTILLKVRIDGYKTIVEFSRVERWLLRRNTDVLVQLLQCDDLKELKVIKHALREHLNIDASATFQVISESCTTNPDIPIEDQADRRQLQAVVLSFLVECIKEKTREDLTRNLQEALLKMLPEANVEQTSLIIQTVMQPLSLSKPTTQGDELLREIILQARSAHEKDLRHQSPDTPITHTFSYLHIAKTITSQHHAANASPLLSFYCEHLIESHNFSKLSNEAQQKVAHYLSDALRACRDNNEQVPEVVSNRITDASVGNTGPVYRLEKLDFDSEHSKGSQYGEMLSFPAVALMTVHEQSLQNSTKQTPKGLADVLKVLQNHAQSATEPSRGTVVPLIDALRKRTEVRILPLPGTSSLPPRPSTVGHGKRKIDVRSQDDLSLSSATPAATPQVQRTNSGTATPSLASRLGLGTPPPRSTSNNTMAGPDHNRPTKKRRSESIETDVQPSLASRLLDSGARASGNNLKSRAPQQPTAAAEPAPAPFGFHIKGAAKTSSHALSLQDRLAAKPSNEGDKGGRRQGGRR
ncbi:hypothetical protein SISNIDRAFT_481344 [Sistotremastrum niveocremeum HHB9708]|uniref:Uncharacterized protein n=1 Tax=Sistotremastrum niveocremeum HHB9708 TaxID=1314777 RepID=A0A165A8M8_9AGAM|nr:hypothetical protein SISNIDRAFT_481344 [Sistotremastrum niveocremeum HHB9708]